MGDGAWEVPSARGATTRLPLRCVANSRVMSLAAPVPLLPVPLLPASVPGTITHGEEVSPELMLPEPMLPLDLDGCVASRAAARDSAGTGDLDLRGVWGRGNRGCCISACRNPSGTTSVRNGSVPGRTDKRLCRDGPREEAGDSERLLDSTVVMESIPLLWEPVLCERGRCRKCEDELERCGRVT